MVGLNNFCITQGHRSTYILQTTQRLTPLAIDFHRANWDLINSHSLYKYIWSQLPSAAPLWKATALSEWTAFWQWQGFLCDFVYPVCRRNATWWSLCCPKSCRLSRRHSCYECHHRSAGAERLAKEGFSAIVFYTICYMHHILSNTDGHVQMHTPQSAPAYCNSSYIYTHESYTFTFVCTSILTLSKIDTFVEHQETCRKVKSPCKYTTQSVSKSTDI